MGGLYSESSGLKVVDTSVYNASKAVAWGDLDLSAYVGRKVALCVFKVTNNTGGALQVLFRKNGDVSNFDGYWAMIGVGIPNGQCGYVLGLTANDGIVEWYSSSALGTITLCLEAFI
jgi:hypothetical protein